MIATTKEPIVSDPSTPAFLSSDQGRMIMFKGAQMRDKLLKSTEIILLVCLIL